MNFLGHAYFSGSDKDVLAGNMFGDFVKGDIEQTGFSDGIKRGLLLHRLIDAGCEDLPSFAFIKSNIGSEFGHFRGVVTDIFLDHIFAKNWSNISSQSLPGFAANILDSLDNYQSLFPKGFQRIFLKMKYDQWLTRNQYIEEIEGILRLIGIHYGRGLKLHKAITVLQENKGRFDAVLPEFIQEMNLYLRSKGFFEESFEIKEMARLA